MSIFRYDQEVRFPVCFDVPIRVDSAERRIVDFKLYLSCSPRLLHGWITLMQGRAELVKIGLPKIRRYRCIEIPTWAPWFGGRVFELRSRRDYLRFGENNPIRCKVEISPGSHPIVCHLDLKKSMNADAGAPFTSWGAGVQKVSIMID